MNRNEALEEIIALAKRHGLTPTDISEALQSSDESATPRKKNIINHVFGYMGGLLIFAGIVIFIGMKWDDIHIVGRIFLTLGFGLCLLIIALTFSQKASLEKAATPLFLIAAILQPIGIIIFLQEYTTGTDPAKAILFISLLLLFQQGLIFLATQRTVLLFTSVFFMYGAFISAFSLLDVPCRTTWLVLSLSLILLTLAITKTRHQPLTPLLFLIGSISFFCVTFDLLKRHPYEIFYLGISCAFVFLAISIRSRTLLATSTLATLAYIGYFTAKHFPNTIGWPITLIIMGMLLIALSSWVIKLDRKYIKRKKAIH
ncbi:DUF2157 domain-containing protein [Legionella sp. W05-934-2]|jgi:hypothetical protein|uniref:DUF2157 domain-containing protein n=1 Tax=Legionella sp. W05-934-2 TaxID=1198649 RepID=UPI003462262D